MWCIGKIILYIGYMYESFFYWENVVGFFVCDVMINIIVFLRWFESLKLFDYLKYVRLYYFFIL